MDVNENNRRNAEKETSNEVHLWKALITRMSITHQRPVPAEMRKNITQMKKKVLSDSIDGEASTTTLHKEHIQSCDTDNAKGKEPKNVNKPKVKERIEYMQLGASK